MYPTNLQELLIEIWCFNQKEKRLLRTSWGVKGEVGPRITLFGLINPLTIIDISGAPREGSNTKYIMRAPGGGPGAEVQHSD